MAIIGIQKGSGKWSKVSEKSGNLIWILSGKPVPTYHTTIYCPVIGVCFYVCYIFSSALKTRFYHGSKHFEP